MITSYEVGAIFKVVDEATTPLRKILGEVKNLLKAVQDVNKEMKLVVPTSEQVEKIGALAKAWGDVAKEMGDAAAGMTTAAKEGAAAAKSATEEAAAARAAAVAGARTSVPIVPGVGGRGGAGGRGGGIFRGHRGGIGHFGGGGVPLGVGRAHFIPGGSMAGWLAAILGYEALKEGAELGEAAWLAQFHLEGGKTTPGMLEKLRTDIQEVSSLTGFDIRDVGEAFEDVFRQTQGMGGDREAFAKEVVKSASAEARAKRTTIKEATSSLTGFAHQFRDYDVETFKKALPYIEFLSTTDPRSLKRMMTAGGYAIPTAIAAGVNPMEAVELGGIMAAAGITNTKTGTWLRAFIQGGLGALPLTPRRFGAGQDLGILSPEGKSTVLNPDGTLNMTKLMATIAEHTKGMTPSDLAYNMRSYFGEQGAGAANLFNDPRIAERIKQIDAIKDERAAGFAGFQKTFNEQNPLQQFRLMLSDLKNVLADIGTAALPPVLSGLHGLDEILKTLHADLPSAVWDKAVKGAALGAGMGFLLGGGIPGALVGAVGGAAIGGAMGLGQAGIDKLLGPRPADWNALAPTTPSVSATPDIRGGFFSPSYTAPPDESGSAKKMNYLQTIPTGSGSGGGQHAGDVFLDGRKVGDIIAGELAQSMGGASEGSVYYDGTHAAPASDHIYPAG
jgi:hypothetical protein